MAGAIELVDQLIAAPSGRGPARFPRTPYSRKSAPSAPPADNALASGEGRGGVARVPSSRLTASEVEPAPIPGQELI